MIYSLIIAAVAKTIVKASRLRVVLSVFPKACPYRTNDWCEGKAHSKA